MKVLILDDEQQRHDFFAKVFRGCEVVHVRTVKEAIEALDSQVFDLVHLDHDLGDIQYNPYPTEYTGADVASYISRMPVEERPDRAVVHSVNCVGGPRLRTILQEAGVDAKWCPYPTYRQED